MHSAMLALSFVRSGAINDGGYTYGEWGLNDGVCKHGGSPVTSLASCQALATLVASTTVTSVNDGTKPKGCYSNYFSWFFYNSHATGAAYSGLRTVCSGGDIYGEPMCCSGKCYVAKTASSSACVAGSSPITSWADCDTAESAISSPCNGIDSANQLTPTVMDPRTTLAFTGMPTGCVWAEVLGSQSTNVYFNTDGTGGTHSERHALCIEAPPLRPDAAPYTLAAYGASACATNSVPIPASVAEPCAAANERLVPGGLSILVHETSTSGKPSGCSHQYRGYSTPYVHRNTYSSGAGSGRDDFQPICTAGVAYSALQANRCDMDITLDRLMVRIGNEPLCEATRASLGLAGVVSIKLQNSFPEHSAKGCYYHDDPTKPAELGVWLNVHATGGVNTTGIFSLCASSDFELGVAGSNTCPAAVRSVDSADACHAAAVAMGITTFSVPPPHSTNLDGCHIRASDRTAYFNINGAGTGSGNVAFQPLCTNTYTFGATGTNACRLGVDIAITTLADCQLAANALGLFGTGDATPNFGSVQTGSNALYVIDPCVVNVLFLARSARTRAHCMLLLTCVRTAAVSPASSLVLPLSPLGTTKDAISTLRRPPSTCGSTHIRPAQPTLSTPLCASPAHPRNRLRMRQP